MPVEKIKDFETNLFEHLTATKESLLASIRESGKLTEESEAELKDAIIALRDKFLGL